METKKNIELLIKSGYPVIYLITWEEDRVMYMCSAIAEEMKKSLYLWTVTDGMICGNKVMASGKRPYSALELIESKDSGIFILRDFHHYIDDHMIKRKLRDLVISFRNTSRTIIITSPVMKIPVELEKDITVIDYKLPSLSEMDSIFSIVTDNFSSQGINISIDTAEEREEIVKSLLGFTRREAEQILAKVAVMKGTIGTEHIELILKEKEQIIRKAGFLEFYPYVEHFSHIGGLNNLKKWLNKRALAFTQKARGFGLPEPKGILLTGLPGCGKSLCAKAIAGQWKKPLLHFDLGRVLGGLVGESERNMRKALKIAESVAPAILWIDEIEKAFSGVLDGGDSGVTSRLLGTLLTWMEEHESPVFIVATANNINILPEELIRRFDEVFFVDLPYQREREEIFRIHLSKRNRDTRDFNMELLAQKSEGFSGSEIEQVIVSSIFDTLSDDVDFNSDLILKNIKETFPLSVSMKERLDLLRKTGKERFRMASTESELPRFQDLNLGDIIKFS